MSKVRPLIRVLCSPGDRPNKWYYAETSNMPFGMLRAVMFYGSRERARFIAKAFLLEICTRLGIPDTPWLRKQISKAVVGGVQA